MVIRFFKRQTNRLSDADARMLTADFLDGLTDIKQEKKLYEYYQQRSVACDLMKYRDMFKMYASLDNSKNGTTTSRPSLKPVAASVAIALLAGAALAIYSSRERDSIAELYAGSYIIRNGHKNTDIKQILSELQSDSHYVDSVLNTCEVFSADFIENEIINSAADMIDDPETRKLFLANI